MLLGSMPFERNQIRWIKNREGRRGHEQESGSGKRPWLIVSDSNVHEHELFIGCPSTEGERPLSWKKFLVPVSEEGGQLPVAADGELPLSKNSRIDVQQIWTFRHDRVCANEPVLSLPNRLVPPILDRLAKHLRSSGETWESRAGFSAGKVVWLALKAALHENQSDLAAIHTRFLELTGVRWPYENRVLCCMVLATDVPARNLAKEELPFPLITVVPLVYAPTLQNKYPENPTVALDGTTTEDGKPVLLSAMTQLLLTVDYACGRVTKNCGALATWRVKKAEYEKIAAEVKSLIGVT